MPFLVNIPYEDKDVRSLIGDMKVALEDFKEVNGARINVIKERNIREYLVHKFHISDQGVLGDVTRNLLALAGVEGYRRNE